MKNCGMKFRRIQRTVYMTCYPLREQEYSESEVITLFNQKFGQRDLRDLLYIDVYFNLYSMIMELF